MSLSLHLQLLYFDRPREMHVARSQLSGSRDLMSFIRLNYSDGKLKDLLLSRLKLLDQIQSDLKLNQIDWLDIQDPNYPPHFHQLSDPPLAIFYQGDIELALKRTLGMVGTRCPSLMASQRLKLIFSVIEDMVIVSGGALGIDSVVHRLSLEHQLPTISVLACGLDQPSPRTNRDLFKDIVDHDGCILSEYPPGVIPKPYYFPQRNRLIAALSSKIVVVEAAKQSGAVITANLASDIAVDVGAMVGAFNSPESDGCYSLINDGAFAIGSVSDFLLFIDQANQLPLFNSDVKYQGIEDIILKKIPTEPIHLEDLSRECSLSMNEMIEYITTLALNDDVVISSGHMVSRHEY